MHSSLALCASAALLVAVRSTTTVRTDEVDGNVVVVSVDSVPVATVDSFTDTVDSFLSQVSPQFIAGSFFSRNYVGADGTVKGADSVLFEVRTADAVGNNINRPQLGAAHTQTARCADSQYADGIDSLAGADRPRPRDISNDLFRSRENAVSRRGLNQFAWQWGQFIDHDVTLIPGSSATEPENIEIPSNDPLFAQSPRGSFIALNRLPAAPGTGRQATSFAAALPPVPREQVNDLTAFVDGSVVYGHEEERANALRTFTFGRLKTDGDALFGLLPRNTLGLENEPELEMVHTPETLGVAGDPRSNEQIGLYNMHTVLLRLHNLLAAEVMDLAVSTGQFGQDPERLDEAVYQWTKLIVTGIIQKITYKDWLPALFGQFAVDKYLGGYPGYWDGVDPRICIEFATAAFRFGHTMLPNSIPLRNADCSVWTDFDPALCPTCNPRAGGIPLKDAFFAQGMFGIPGFFEAAHNGFQCTLAGETDVTVVEGVRDFLFGDGTVNGQNVFPTHLDLVSLNIQRGREHGLADYNTIRRFYRLFPRESFAEITDVFSMQEKLSKAAVGDIDNIDAFIGLLAEDHLPGGSFGETLSKVVLDQFKKLRDGDRFWYENYLRPTSTIRAYIEKWTLADILRETAVNPEALFHPPRDIFLNPMAIPEDEVPANVY